MPTADYREFIETVWDYYAHHGRHDLPWRKAGPAGFDPYAIMVSELMLQQTQVARVIPKYREFIKLFPDTVTLAAAPLKDVLTAWSGLGYNRRAQYLQRAAIQVETACGGQFPFTIEGLVALPGVGKNTAGAIAAYAYNQPVTYIETNIRTLYIHHFFADSWDVTDTAILQLVADTVDQAQPREWYWALMDYGSHLKRTVGNASRQSKSHQTQSTFKGSRRQIRGQVLKQLTVSPLSAADLRSRIPDERLSGVLDDLVAEALIGQTGDSYHL